MLQCLCASTDTSNNFLRGKKNREKEGEKIEWGKRHVIDCIKRLLLMT